MDKCICTEEPSAAGMNMAKREEKNWEELKGRGINNNILMYMYTKDAATEEELLLFLFGKIWFVCCVRE